MAFVEFKGTAVNGVPSIPFALMLFVLIRTNGRTVDGADAGAIFRDGRIADAGCQRRPFPRAAKAIDLTAPSAMPGDRKGNNPIGGIVRVPVRRRPLLMTAAESATRRIRKNAVEIVCKGRLAHKYAAAGAFGATLMAGRGEAENLAILLTRDAPELRCRCRAGLAKRHGVIGPCEDDNAIRSGHQNRCDLPPSAIDGHRLGNGDGAESAGIKRVKFRLRARSSRSLLQTSCTAPPANTD